ncbi:UDP-glucose 6-dehydrogenase [candidate division WOR-3 bacterium JGI_Cruoil_03_51_56]|uniref:UDP-glucose 6-dehydrogenase n=1 Tax=candidate division WOR-3 bacterium JGI_Cruoil_03_51_56 TaxID=1973747 RepID=A0A235BUL8_UNCW3|nr:MAG: UDP-glucose 6-dehydrogenase [candidate division WOR-3 bacterium JGI_Cruoil_03_51_56]
MKIAMIGTGYVGLTTGACFAKIGHEVICVDNDSNKIETLNSGKMPIYEPGLHDIVKEMVTAHRLSFTTDIKTAVHNSTVCFIAVGTPPRGKGEPDLAYVENVAREIATSMEEYLLIVEKSTVPVQTHKWIRTTIERYNRTGTPFDVASNPEFLREGSAVNDFLNPDRIVIGVESDRASDLMKEIYKPLNAPIVITDLASAELIKHASNAFLAMKISFANALAVVCEASGADVHQVTCGMGMDKRIGPSFLDAGIGYGGFCFPKDLRAFIHIAEELGYDFKLLREVENINNEMKLRFIRKIQSVLWNLQNKNIGVLGLSFKPDTDDMRFAPSIDIIAELVHKGAHVRAYDPKAMERARKIIPGIEFCSKAEDVAEDADILLLLTEWSEFKQLDLTKLKKRMRVPIICDGRNMLKRTEIEKQGFTYLGVGR